MRRILLLVAISVALPGQTSTDTKSLTRDLRTALERDDLAKAADLAASLDDMVRAARDAWLVRDAKMRTDEVLGCLPVDTEGFWVNQQPFSINPDESLQILRQQPTLLYSLDRLAALNSGNIYRALSNKTVRMVMAATRGVRYPNEFMIAIPGHIGNQDVVYFYFLSQPLDLSPADESIENRPVWRGVAEDENWIALAKPDLLVLSNRKALLAEILGRMQRGSSSRALPQSLPEWQEVDREASFWGLRHYTDLSRPKQGEWGFPAAELPNPDGSAVGVAVRLDPKKQRIEIRYLSAGRPKLDTIQHEVQMDQPREGVWRLVANLNERGPTPAHIALIMLGFGVYR